MTDSNSKLIIESALMSEAQVVKMTPTKAIFRCPIQTVDEVNQNRRLYPSDVLKAGMEQCDTRMRRRAFYSELDHPLPSGNDQVDGVRQTTVLLKEASHIIRNYDFVGNVLWAEMETLSEANGRTLFGLIRDKTGVGFSMRGMAELERGHTHNTVIGPLTIMAFDAVSMPSHRSAVVDFNQMRFESKSMLTESACGTICIGDKCFMPDYFDKLVETKMITFFDSWV